MTENLLIDLRYAVRVLLRSPGFACIAIATIALGVGATAAIYSVIDATLLHPLPFPNPTQLIHVEDDLPGTDATDVGISIPEWKDLQRSGIFQSVALSSHGANTNLTGGSEPERLTFKWVTTNYFTVLGVSAQLGHALDPADVTPGVNLQAVISDGLWRQEYGADPRIIGKTLLLDNDPYQIVGVMPRGFRDQGSTRVEQNADVWLGAGFTGEPFPPPRRDLRLHPAVTARLSPGLPVTAARRRLDALVASLKKQYPADYPTKVAWTVQLIPLSDSVVASVHKSLVLLFGAVGLVLLISCVNIANLLLARASARDREVTVRLALGAQRTRLIRALLTEILLLFLFGGIAGFAILFAAQRFLLRLVPESLPHLNDIGVGWSVLGFAVVISVVAGAICGIAPAWFMSRGDLIGTLRQDSRGSKGSKESSRARQFLVIGELALSLVLMVAACLLLRSFWDLFNVRPGFNLSRVMVVQTWLPRPNDSTADAYHTATQEAVLLREVLRRTRDLPGVQEVAIGNTGALPLDHSKGDLVPLALIREGLGTTVNEAPTIGGALVTPEYFHLLGMPLERGRTFTDQDLEPTTQVAVINEAAAHTYWPGQDPVGRRVHLGVTADRSPSRIWTTIIGVIGDAHTESLGEAVAPRIYLSMYQRAFQASANQRGLQGLAVFLRGQLDPRGIPAQVRQQIQSIEPELPVFGAETMDDVLSASLSVRRFTMEMVAFFAATALLLAGLGIYGTISFLVNEQRREFAIRLALGAQKARVLEMVLRRALALAAAGTGLGVAGALIVSHLMAGLLYGVSPTDLPTFAGVTLVLTAVAVAASYIPALRAMRLDPIAVLHSE